MEEFTEWRAASGSAQGEAREGRQSGRHFVDVRRRTVDGQREDVEMRSHQLGIIIQLGTEEWEAFRDGIKAGEFDDL